MRSYDVLSNPGFLKYCENYVLDQNGRRAGMCWPLRVMIDQKCADASRTSVAAREALAIATNLFERLSLEVQAASPK